MGLSKDARMQHSGSIFMVKLGEPCFLYFGVFPTHFQMFLFFPGFPTSSGGKPISLNFFQLLEAKKSAGIATRPGGQCHLEAKDLFVCRQLCLHGE